MKLKLICITSIFFGIGTFCASPASKYPPLPSSEVQGKTLLLLQYGISINRLNDLPSNRIAPSYFSGEEAIPVPPGKYDIHFSYHTERSYASATALSQFRGKPNQVIAICHNKKGGKWNPTVRTISGVSAAEIAAGWKTDPEMKTFATSGFCSSSGQDFPVRMMGYYEYSRKYPFMKYYETWKDKPAKEPVLTPDPGGK